MSLTDRELLARALRFYEGCPDGQYDELMVELIRERLAQQEPAAWKWQQAPIRTAWGAEMVVASVAIDKDHTVDLYCERDQTSKVDSMFAQPAPATELREQEPVAHRDDFWCADLTCKKCYSADFRFKHKNSVVNESLTTPAQRTWVELTEDEAFACKGRDYFETYKAIEAKLKEKNT